MYNFNAA
jgi:hypothetical protein